MSASSIARAALAASRNEQLEVREQFFSDIGWTTERRGSRDAQSLSLLAGGVPQVFVTGVGDPASAVSLGYSSEAPLTLRWSRDELWLARTEVWERTPGDSALVSVPAQSEHAAFQVLQALARDRVAGVLQAPQEGSVHARLADHLAAAFAELRFRVAEAGEADERNVFRLFHQLLFVRFHEDRFGPTAGAGRVSSLVDEAQLDRLQSLLHSYADQFDSELFGEQVDVGALPPSPVLHVIKTLVEPWEELRLDFSVTASDVAGRLYQSFLASTPSTSVEERLFPVALPVNRQRGRGAFYTPGPLAELVTQRCLAPLLEERKPASPSEIRVLDPACGSGAFLLAAFRVLRQYFSERGGGALDEAFRIRLIEESLFGADDDETAVSLTRVQLLEEARIDRQRLPLLRDNILVANALRVVPSEASPRWLQVMAEGGFDSVLSNPPFHSPKGARAAGVDTAALRRRFAASHGTGANLAYAFLELARSWVADDGRVSMLLPQSVLDGPSGAKLRNLLGDELIDALDFGHNELFLPAMSYVAAITIDKSPSRPKPRLTRVTSLGNNVHEIKEDLDSLLESHQPSDATRQGAFTLSASRDLIDATKSWSPFLVRWWNLAKDCIGVDFVWFDQANAPRVAIGTQTGDDARFVLATDRWVERSGSITIDGAFSVPASYVPRWIRGSAIRPFAVEPVKERVVVPRLGENRQVDRLIEHLGGVPDSFRPGDLGALRGHKVVVRSLFDEPAAVADRAGDLMIPQGGAGAMALVPRHKADVLVLEALCNSALYQWLFEGFAHIKSRGFSQLMRHHWSYVPWPALSSENARRVRTAGGSVRAALRARTVDRVSRYWDARTALDEVVFDALAVTTDLRRLVTEELWRRP